MLALMAFLSIAVFYKFDAFNITLWVLFVVILFVYMARRNARKQKQKN